MLFLHAPPLTNVSLPETRKNAHELVWLKQNKSKQPKYHSLVPVSVSMYNAVEEQTDDTPLITASNETIHSGVVALSRDLEEKYNFKFGDLIFIKEINKSLIFKDRMNKRFKNSVDIYSKCEKEAKEFGRRTYHLVIYKEK
jgi:3D (Asp-Asp-Asp) domain-containing protein